MAYRMLADLVLVTHAGFIAFVIAALVLILLGGAFGWGWVRNRWFRSAHLAAIGFVVLQAWCRIACPLTTLENHFRQLAGQQAYGDGFIAHWLHQLIFFQAEPWVFALAYTLFGLLVLSTLWLVPVHWRSSRPAGSRVS